MADPYVLSVCYPCLVLTVTRYWLVSVTLVMNHYEVIVKKYSTLDIRSVIFTVRCKELVHATSGHVTLIQLVATICYLTGIELT